MSRTKSVELVLKFGAWILLTASAIALLISGFANDMITAKIIGVIDGVLIIIALLYLFAKWLAKGQ